MVRALFVGRFQPFHNGHLEALKSILKECDEVVIGIGSSQDSHELENPFTVGERIEMIYESIKEAGLAGRCFIVGIPDIKYNALWVKHLKVLSPSFDVVYSNNPLVKRLFKEENIEVKPLKMVERKELDGTFIRKLMLDGNREWVKLLPPAAARVALKIGVEERLKEVSRGDKV